MSATIIALAKLLASALSAGLLYQGFSPSQHGALLTKIAGVIVSICTIVTLIPDVRDFFTPAEAGQTEQKFWDGVLKYREEHKNNKMDCEYVKKYPEGQFIVLAKAECPDTITDKVPTPVKLVVPAPVKERADLEAKKLTAEQKTPESAAPVGEWQAIDHYLVKGGLVKDTKTGLMWMRCSLGQTWDGSTCAGEAKKYTKDDAMKQENTSQEGYDDWQIPNFDELKTLVFCSSKKIKIRNEHHSICDDESTSPTINTNAFPNTLTDSFWSSSPYAPDSSYTWTVGFYNGDGGITKETSSYVRLVRAGETQNIVSILSRFF